MIFYFTGTGNSLYAAQKLVDEGEEIVSIVEALRSKSFHYTLKDNEPLGFVFPVYFYTVSDPVLELVRHLTVENAGFVYAVIPCGASIGAAGGFLKSELKKRGLELQRLDALVVPDGALIFYDIDSPEKMEKQLEAATKELASIKQAVDRREGNRITGSPVLGKVGLAAYHACMSTKAFFRRREVRRLRKVRIHLPVRGDRNGRRPPGLDKEQMPQMLRLHQSLPGLRDPVRQEDGLPRALCESGFEVRPGNTRKKKRQTGR